ncbi:MAG: hypothetical protein IPP64_12190 [Bacteroidetes bacterium]|nr:hypothetical protein [Bacteroidota bacterium]
MNKWILYCIVWTTLSNFSACANQEKSDLKNIISGNEVLTSTDSLAQLTKIYSQAIADFIKDANKKNKTKFDTLYFGNRKNGQPDDFPNIKLPETIAHTHIRLISPEEGTIKQNELKSRIYINLMGWVEKESAEFIFYIFSNGFEHQYNYTINYKYNTQRKEFELTNLQFEVANKKK